MKDNCTEMVFILDRSGSMQALNDDTIGGFNSMIEQQKKVEGEAYVTTVLFDDRIERLHKRVPLAAVKPLTDKECFARGSTALLDAIGETVSHVNQAQEKLPEAERPAHTVVVITTDGQENSSREYNRDGIRRLIERQKKVGWEFLFLGAGIDAFDEAGSLGIDRSRVMCVEHDSDGVQDCYEGISYCMKGVRMNREMLEDWATGARTRRLKNRKNQNPDR